MGKKLKIIVTLTLILGPSLYFGILSKPAEMGIALAAGALAAAFINIEKLQKFKGAGIEFELKEAVKEAQATIETLKSFTEPLFVSSIRFMSDGLTWDGIPINVQHDIVRKIEKVANDNKASDDVREAIEGFYNRKTYDYFVKVNEIVNKYRNETVEKNLWELIDLEAKVFPSEKQLRSAIKELKLSVDLEESIKDYIYYKENRYPRT
jgi:hypothetical protein